MTNNNFLLKGVLFRQKRFIIGFILLNTLIAVIIKVYLTEQYKTNNLLYTIKSKVKTGSYYLEENPKKSQKVICSFIEYQDLAKKHNCTLKIDIREKRDWEMFLYCESIDKEQLNSKVDSIMKDIHFYEEKQKEILVLSSLNISQFTFSSLIGESKIYKNEFYLNNYFIFAVFLLSFIVSILLALMKQKFIDKSI